MIDMSKKYRYRNGEPARILCDDRPGTYPVVSMNASGTLRLHCSNGYADLLSISHDMDLILDVPLWRSDSIWVSPDGTHAVLNPPNFDAYAHAGYRRITVVEERSES